MIPPRTVPAVLRSPHAMQFQLAAAGEGWIVHLRTAESPAGHKVRPQAEEKRDKDVHA